ncbi:MAG: SIS domain-containing protein [Endomicrobium sp.]|nr:SIS domain-containing protein [Endomicrobium sp.]
MSKRTGIRKKTIICGNGGSASDALHFAAEMVNRFEKNRGTLASIALSENISTITAIGNDFSYDCIFRHQLEAFAQKGDIFIAISTSGKSPNIIKAPDVAKQLSIFTIGFTNSDGRKMKDICDYAIRSIKSYCKNTGMPHTFNTHHYKNCRRKIF